MFQSNSRYYLKSSISASATAGSTFNMSTDFELGLTLETGTDTVSVVLKNATQIERMEITATGGVATIVKRGLDQSSSKVQVTALKKSWSDGTVMYVAALASDMMDVDKTSGTATVSSDTDFSGYFRATGRERIPVFADSTARDAVYTSPNTGDVCVVTGVGEQYYEGGSWHTLGVGTPTPNASDTVAGKVETATNAEMSALADVGGTGANLHPLPSQVMKSTSLSATSTSTLETDFYAISTVADGKNGKITKANVREDLAASETAKGTVERATDAEATTGTDTTRYVTPKQVKDNYDVTVNGTYSQKASSAGPYATQTIYSASFLLSKTTVGTLAVGTGSAGSANGGLQKSTDNSSWSDLYNFSGSSVNVSFPFLMQKGLYYRVKAETTAN